MAVPRFEWQPPSLAGTDARALHGLITGTAGESGNNGPGGSVVLVWYEDLDRVRDDAVTRHRPSPSID